MYDTKRLWWTLGIILLVSFGILGFMGGEIYRAMPPVPDAYVAADGEILYTRDDIERGRQVWQTTGGHQQGSIWGHGAYVAPDWTADWLHREAVALLEIYAQRDFGVPFGDLDEDRRAGLEQRLKRELRENTFDPETRRVTVSAVRAAAILQVAAHYEGLFGDDPELAELREAYAMMQFPVPDAERRRLLGAFVFWSSWAAATNRPGSDITYTNNWPHEKLIDNTPTGAAFMWTFISILVLLAGVGALAWHYATIHGREAPPEVPQIDPLHNLQPTPSMRATAKYFWVVTALFGLQVVLGGITAHYAVEGQAFYGFNLSEVLPYVITRTWHTQLAVLWIATAWLATGLYIAPAISGHEPKFQRLGVNFLFACLLLIVSGSMVGQWLGVMQKLGLDINFWFGHQGWEYVDLGRFWQIFLFIGLMLWLTLVGRALWPALMKKDEGRPLVILLFLSTVAIGLFYGAGLMWGKHTHLSIVEYWRWWVVHLWVEGFFEVFATAVIAFLFTKLGLVRTTSAVTAVLFATIVFLTGGVLGTFHHLYFAGTPTAVLAIGAAFSALEVVPLVLIGFEAYENWQASRHRGWIATYKWPIMFFISVAFWNLVGAGLFGFLINPPLALYYMQGLNTTPLHAHTALFGVYGMLGIGLMLFCLRGLTYRQVWNEKLLKISFWSLNLGLAAMAVFSLLPLGLMQVWASVTEGFWYARSAEFLQQPLMQTLVWLRVPGDVLFSIGVAALAWFVFRLYFGPRESVPAKARSPVAEA
ncbi:MAG TPA: nitric-oxide reductase large subunit [Gammaproteobacteria bacterium]|nr:nitric-oxide reductase large subunit [Gammaproteobacteria bacterium]